MSKQEAFKCLNFNAVNPALFLGGEIMNDVAKTLLYMGVKANPSDTMNI